MGQMRDLELLINSRYPFIASLRSWAATRTVPAN